MNEEIRSLIERYLAQDIDRSSFAQEFADLYFRVRRSASAAGRDAKMLCDSIVGPFAELSGGHRTEQSFRVELTRIARPLVSRIK